MAHDLQMVETMREYGLTFLLSIFLISSSALEGMAARRQSARVSDVTRDRDKIAENAVAKQFEAIRASAGLPQLTRIKHRASLEQQLCTTAYLGKLPVVAVRGSISTSYLTENPESISNELKQLALYTEHGGKKALGYPRYSVAVWRVRDVQTGKATYWVAVRLYGSALGEFVDGHFTDDALYPQNAWKKSIAPECRGK